MRSKAYIFFLLSLSAGIARAEPQTLVVTGFNDRHSFNDIAGEIENFSREKKRGYRHFSLDPKMQQPERGPSLVGAQTQAAAKAVKPGESLLLFVSDHGSRLAAVRDPLDSGIDLPGGQVYPHRRLIEDVKAALPADAWLVMIGTHCFSGGLHHVAFARPQSCSAASTSFREITNNHETLPAYDTRISELLGQPKVGDIDGDGKVSLYEAHLVAVIGDVVNDGRGQISSGAFVDSTLKEGAYSGEGGRPNIVSSFAEKLALLQLTDFKAAKSILGSWVRTVEVPDSGGCSLPVIEDKPLESFLSFVSNAGPAVQAQSRLVTSLEPARLRVYADYVRRTMAEAEKTYAPQVRSRLRQYAALRAEYETAKAKAGGKLSPQSHARFTAEFDKLNFTARNQLAILWNLRMLQESFRRVDKFYRNAGVEEKKRFNDLLDCETRPL